jgi:hypothetical protein
MEMPCYDKCKTFYYYDVLEALSRHLFQTLIQQQRAELLEELGSDSSSDGDNGMSDKDSSDGDDILGTDTTFNENFKQLTER